MSPIHELSQWAEGQAAPPVPRGRDAAEQFEALLLTQILHSAHDEESGWLGSGDDSAESCAGDYAEQQLAVMLAQKGGLGLSKLIATALEETGEKRKP
jgi:Rod binding domain-containing protein